MDFSNFNWRPLFATSSIMRTCQKASEKRLITWGAACSLQATAINGKNRRNSHELLRYWMGGSIKRILSREQGLFRLRCLSIEQSLLPIIMANGFFPLQFWCEKWLGVSDKGATLLVVPNEKIDSMCFQKQESLELKKSKTIQFRCWEYLNTRVLWKLLMNFLSLKTVHHFFAPRCSVDSTTHGSIWAPLPLSKADKKCFSVWPRTEVKQQKILVSVEKMNDWVAWSIFVLRFRSKKSLYYACEEGVVKTDTIIHLLPLGSISPPAALTSSVGRPQTAAALVPTHKQAGNSF